MQRVMPTKKSKEAIIEKYKNREKVLTRANIALVLGVAEENIRADRSLILINFDSDTNASHCLKKLIGSRKDLAKHGGYYLEKNNGVYGLMKYDQINIGNEALDHFKEVIQKGLMSHEINHERNTIKIQCSSSTSSSEKPSVIALESEDVMALEEIQRADCIDYYDQINSLINRLEQEIKRRIGVKNFIEYYTHLSPGFNIKRKEEKLAFLKAVIEHYNHQEAKNIKISVETVKINNEPCFQRAMVGFFSQRTSTLVKKIREEKQLEQTDSKDEKTIASRC